MSKRSLTIRASVAVMFLPLICSGYSKSDFNCDGTVNFKDFAEFSEDWLVEDTNGEQADMLNTPIWKDLTDKVPNLFCTYPGNITSHGLWGQTVNNSPQLFTGYRVCLPGAFADGMRHSLIWEDSDNNLYALCHTSALTDDQNLQRSTDGGVTWEKVIFDHGEGGGKVEFPANTNCGIQRAFVDLGSGKLLYFDYVLWDVDKCVYKSEDHGATWSQIFKITAAAHNPIGHTHGAIYDSDSGYLYIMTGDWNHMCSILVCDDVTDFLKGEGSWSTDWRAKWGLADGKYRGEGGNAIDPDYCINTDLASGVPQTQRFRVVDFHIETHDGVKYGYWGVDDDENTVWSGTINRINLSAFEADHTDKRVIKLADIYGVSWYWGTSNGYPVMGTQDRAGPKSDGYCRLYGLADDRKTVVELAKWQNYNHGAVIAGAIVKQECDFLGGLVIKLHNVGISSSLLQRYSIGKVVPLKFLNKEVDETIIGDRSYNFKAINLFPDPMLTDTDPTASPYYWWTNNATLLREATSPLEDGRRYSYKIEADNNNGFAGFRLANERFDIVQGNVLTLSLMLYIPDECPEGQDIQLRLWELYEVKHFDHTDAGKWFNVVFSPFHATAGTTALNLYIYPHNGVLSGSEVPIYISSPRLVLGNRPGGEGIPSIYMWQW